MMLDINKAICTVVLMCAVVLAGCVKSPIEEPTMPNNGGTIEATFTLAPDFVEEIEVRSVPNVDEGIIKDVWVIQLNAAGTAQLQAPQYITTLTQGASDYKIAMLLKPEASRIYFIANTHASTLYNTTHNISALVEEVRMQFPTEASLVSANSILMSGVWTGTPELVGMDLRVSLSRAVAKVNFNLNASLPNQEGFKLLSLTVKQVPDVLYFYRADNTETPYPTTPTVQNYTATDYDYLELGSTPESLWWYLPENTRGTGPGTKQEHKAEMFPGFIAGGPVSAQAAYCTYIEVAGLYEAANGTYETTYRIYLGANNTNDYNVRRNTVYNINTTIKGIDAADTRINTTDATIIVGMFGGWDEQAQEYTTLLEVECNDESKIEQTYKWSNDGTPTGATDIHYGPTNINILKGSNEDLSNYPAAKYCNDKGNGWYLPAQNQLMAIWAAHEGIPKKFSFSKTGVYWSATDALISSGGWYTSFLDGSTTYYTDMIDPSGFVRCVRDVAPKGTELPQVVVGVDGAAIIDCRAMPAGAITTAKKPRTIAEGITTADNNKTVSHYFEVVKSSWIVIADQDRAVDYCAKYASQGNKTWRLPTQRELQLLFTLQNSLITKVPDFAPFSPAPNDRYVAATTAWLIHFSSGLTEPVGIANAGYVRCVRDLNEGEDTPEEPDTTKPINEIKLRLQQNTLGKAPTNAYVETLFSRLTPEGFFTDIDYDNPAFNSGAKKVEHLVRLGNLSKAYMAAEGTYSKSPEVYDAIVRGLDSWIDRNIQDQNWWQHAIAFPNKMVTALVLMADELMEKNKEVFDKCVAYQLKTWPTTMAGANGTDVCKYVFATAIASENEALLQEVMDKIGNLVVIVTGKRSEGIHPDYSFTQHNTVGRQIYLATYGREYLNGIVYFLIYTQGTKYNLPMSKIEILENLFLENVAWTWYRGDMDFNQYGRGVLRASTGPSFKSMTTNFANMNTPRTAELKNIVAIMNGTGELNGNKMFPRGDYMIHRPRGAMITTRMTSVRTVGNEAGNGEGANNYHTGDGANYIKVSGAEYSPILYAGWNWRRIPGTTVISDSRTLPVPSWGKNGLGGSEYASGASDGQNGVCAFIYSKDKLKAHKGWFYFDKYFVALGAGIHSDRTDFPAITTVNQTRLTGSVTSGDHPSASSLLWHNNVGYRFEPATVASHETSSGNYPSGYTGKTCQSLLIEINHGVKPQGESYAYAVYPNLSQSEFMVCGNDYTIISNTSSLQAVQDVATGKTMAAFYSSGSFEAEGFGAISVSDPCLLIIDKIGGEAKITVASPYCDSRPEVTISVTVAGKSYQ